MAGLSTKTKTITAIGLWSRCICIFGDVKPKTPAENVIGQGQARRAFVDFANKSNCFLPLRLNLPAFAFDSAEDMNDVARIIADHLGSRGWTVLPPF